MLELDREPGYLQSWWMNIHIVVTFVMTPDGEVYHWNRRDIRKTSESTSIFQREICIDADDEPHSRESLPSAKRNPPPIPPKTTQVFPIPGTPKGSPMSNPNSSTQVVRLDPPPSISTPVTRPPNVSIHGRVRKPNTKYDPNIYKL